MAKSNRGPKSLPKPGGEAPKPNKELAEKLIAVCKAFPHVKVIYVNQAGEYHFHAVDGFSPVDAVALRDADADDFISEEETVSHETDKGDGKQQTEPVKTDAGNQGGATGGEKSSDNIEF